ncbi:hypothetical protein K0T92_19715 [Paenibacillus oenotherae]|uniref:Ketosynthase family 3 (KS3) domain-containing protein n=1 Tax=Paenibacillus oenotherae TaxID=1435645 RepID=A0ABS7DAY6_9BACL|nr:beta-ketoacyl synthase N-terminal-like domain-containing protein [Paenibacillus oenotherae]MBW7476949.1 hypothetical protein [Paenibacillus oenotherae]
MLHKSDDPIVVTGLGAVSPYGLDIEQLWSSIESGANVRSLLDEELSAHVQGPVYGNKIEGWDPVPLLGKKGMQFMKPSAQYLLGSSVLALKGAGFEEELPNPDDLAVVVSTNHACTQVRIDYDYTAITDGPKSVSPMDAPNTLTNAPASYLAIRIQSRAANTTIANGQCGGLDALGYACNLLRKGRAKYVVVGGVEEINSRVLWVYDNANVLSKQSPENAGKSFDESSTGWLPSEGSGAIVLERQSDALARGAKILAEIVSWSSSFVADPSPEKRAAGLARTMNNTLRLGGLTADDVELVIAGASGVREQDAAEAIALNSVFASQPDVPVSAVKATIGECYGASGIFQTIAAIGAIQRSVIPATPGYETPQEAVPAIAGIRSSARAWNNKQDGTVLISAQDIFGASSAVVIRSAV